MPAWRQFKDQRFSLKFRYPEETPQGFPVEIMEREHNGMVRVHLVSSQKKELYFEVTKYPALSAQFIFQEHTAELESRFEDLLITELREIDGQAKPAHEYSFRWNQGVRSVLLFERQHVIYRILYDPQAPLNTEVLSTLEFIT